MLNSEHNSEHGGALLEIVLAMLFLVIFTENLQAQHRLVRYSAFAKSGRESLVLIRNVKKLIAIDEKLLDELPISYSCTSEGRTPVLGRELYHCKIALEKPQKNAQKTFELSFWRSLGA